MCPRCKNSGEALGYFNGKVLRAICYCKHGERREKELDELCKDLKMNVELHRKCRVRLKDEKKY